MTLGDMTFEVILRLKRGVMSISLDRPTAKILINEALQFVYPFAVQMDRSFYIRSAAFSGAAVNLPTSHKMSLVFVVPTAKSYCARIVNNREYVPVNNNPYVQGTTDDPVVTVNATQFLLTPSSNGTQYFMWSFPYQDTEANDLTLLGTPSTPAVIPWMLEELVILKAMEYARIRHNLQPVVGPSETEKRLAIVQSTYKQMVQQRMPLALFAQETPVAPPPQGGNA